MKTHTTTNTTQSNVAANPATHRPPRRSQTAAAQALAQCPEPSPTTGQEKPMLLAEDTKAWLESRPELMRRLEEMRRICENAQAEHNLLSQAEAGLVKQLDATGRELVRAWLEQRNTQEQTRASADASLRRHSKKKLRVTTLFGPVQAQEQTMQGARRHVRPVCEACAIKPGGYSQGVSEALVDFGAHESFEHAAQRLARHYPVGISDTTLRKHTLKAARKARAQQEIPVTPGTLPAHGPECIEAQADGTMLPMLAFKEGGGDKRKRRRTHWQEQRLCATRVQGSVQTRYACSMENVEALGRAWAETARQNGWALDTQLHVVGDGASWVGQQARQHFGKQSRVLVDFYHVSEYLAAVAQRHKPEDKTWLARQQNRLKKGDYRQVIKQLESLVESTSVPDELAVARNAHRYLSNRSDQLWYDEALALGRSIGSGLIEGSHRHVLQARLKLSGAWWLPENAKAMSHLRVHLANNANTPDSGIHELFPLAC